MLTQVTLLTLEGALASPVQERHHYYPRVPLASTLHPEQTSIAYSYPRLYRYHYHLHVIVATHHRDTPLWRLCGRS